MMHEESPPAKNSFLEDLDKLDVRISSRRSSRFQLTQRDFHNKHTHYSYSRVEACHALDCLKM